MHDKILFARVGWMKRYKGTLDDDEKPIGGGENNKLNIGHELFNFARVGRRVLGYFQPQLQPRRRRKKSPSTIHLQRIKPGFSGNSLKGVLVVFVAKRPQIGGQFIVGWYQNATVYRHEQRSSKPERDGYGYFVETNAGNEVLVPCEQRSFKVPGGKGGLGRANICYANDDRGLQKKNSEWMDEALGYTSSYHLEDAAENPASETDKQISETVGATVERAAGYQSNPRIRRAVEKYAMEWALRRLTGMKLDPKDKHTTMPYDFLCVCDGRDLYVEVKGTQESGRCISLTPNEVEQAKKHRSALFIVHSVKVKGKRTPQVSGGTELFLREWDINIGKLESRGYTYTLPSALLAECTKAGRGK